jgi:hypothetical protein
MRQRTGDATENEHIHVSASHVCTRTGLAYKGMERSSPFPCPLPLLRRDGLSFCHIFTPATSAPGLGAQVYVRDRPRGPRRNPEAVGDVIRRIPVGDVAARGSLRRRSYCSLRRRNSNCAPHRPCGTSQHSCAGLLSDRHSDTLGGGCPGAVPPDTAPTLHPR